jgi:hypothetical protein
LDQTTIDYAELQQYEDEMNEITHTVAEIEFTPLEQPTPEFAREITEAVASSDNIIVFPRSPRSKTN